MSFQPLNANGQATSANSSPVVVASDQSNLPTNTKQLNGTTIDTNSGTKSAGTQRVVIATDQPSLTNALPISATSLPLPTGAALDATLTGGTQQAKVTDGTNIGNVVKSDATFAGQNAQLIAGNRVEVAVNTTTTGAQNLASMDVSNFRYGTFQLTVAGAGLTFTIQGSNDNSNWITIPIRSVASASNGFSTTAQTTTLLTSEFYLFHRYFRINVTAMTSGTTTGTLEFYSVPPPPTTISIAGNQATNIAQINAVTPLMGNGVTGTGSQRVTIASDNTAFSVNAVQSGTWTVQPGNTANSTPWLVTDTAATTGGLSIVTGSVGATATAIKASAGQLYGYHFLNTTAAVAYVQIFNVASGSVTLGTTAPTISIGIPASGGVTANFDKGIAFGTAISFGCTTTRTGSTGATCDVNFYYK